MRSYPLVALVAASLVMPHAAIAQQRVVRGGVTYSRPAMHPGPVTRPMPGGGVKPGWNGTRPGWTGGKPGWNGTRPGWNGNKPGWNGTRPGWNGTRPNWGGRWNGRWTGGWNAPGGWGGYRQPIRGYVLPSYWVAPQFGIANYASYGLSQPPYGYNWSRYYDDAVLADGNGRVWDSVRGVEWNDYDEGYADGYEDGAQGDGYVDSAGYANGGYYDGAAGSVSGSGYAYDGYRGNDGRYYGERRDSGVGGALIGGAVGAVAGSAIAGRGNRLGGALIGGGLGALAGQAIDKAEDRGRYDRGPISARGYGAGYPPPSGYDSRAYGANGYYGGAPQVVYAQPRESVQPYHVETSDGWSSWKSDGVTVATTTGVGHVGGGYYHPGASTTVVTVAGAPTTTTTVTEYVEEVEARPAAKRAVRPARKWKPAPKKRAACACQCVCR